MSEEFKPRSVVAEINLFTGRLTETVERLIASREADPRVIDVVTLAIQFWDMMDSIDHETSTDGRGTPEIRSIIREGRRLAEARHPDTSTE